MTPKEEYEYWREKRNKAYEVWKLTGEYPDDFDEIYQKSMESYKNFPLILNGK